MNHFQGITAKIISNGQVLNFYDDPDAAEGQDSRACHYYVEAVAGSTFQVKVDLTPQFSFYKMKAGHAVKVTVTIAGRHGSLEAIFTTKYLQQAFSRAKSCTYTFTGPKHFCKETRQWMWSDYSFGNLVLSMLDLSVSIKWYHQSDKIPRRDTRSWLFRQASSEPW